MTNILDTLNLHELRGGSLPGLSEGMAGHFVEAASICLDHNGHIPGNCNMMVRMITEAANDTDTQEQKVTVQFKLDYPPATDIMKRAHNDQQMATEFGAYGIAVAVMFKTTEYKILRQARKSTSCGFDFFLSSSEDDDNIFKESARLEVSGILENPGDIRARVKKKIKQTQASDATGLAKLVAVIEFSTPQAEMVHQ